MIRVLDKNGCQFFSTELTGHSLFKWYNQALGTEIFQIEGGSWVASYASLLANFGNLSQMKLPSGVKYVVEIIARKYKYRASSHSYDIKPFFCVEELDCYTIIFMEFDFSQYKEDVDDRQQSGKDQDVEARVA